MCETSVLRVARPMPEVPPTKTALGEGDVVQRRALEAWTRGRPTMVSFVTLGRLVDCVGWSMVHVLSGA